jgi:hypothetical protein
VTGDAQGQVGVGGVDGVVDGSEQVVPFDSQAASGVEFLGTPHPLRQHGSSWQ